MAADWERYCRRSDLEAEEDGIRVTLLGGSVHWVSSSSRRACLGRASNRGGVLRWRRAEAVRIATGLPARDFLLVV